MKKYFELYDGKAVTVVEKTFPEYFWLREENAENFTRQANKIYTLFKNNIISAEGELTEHGKDLIGQLEKESEDYRKAGYANRTRQAIN